MSWLSIIQLASDALASIFRHVEESHRKNIVMASLLNQVLFFMLADCFFCPEDRLTGLYCLLFYNVFGYMVWYAGRLLKMHGYSPIVKVSEHSNIRHLALTATKVVLDLAKAVTFAITFVFILLVFGLEQGLEHFNPTPIYLFLTAAYYISTEPKCHDKVLTVLGYLQIDRLEGLEVLWCPVLLRIFSSLMSVLLITVVWFYIGGSWLLIFSCGYINVYLSLRDMGEHWSVLLRERSVLDQYRLANRSELASLQDDVCAVCLQSMRRARVTKCHHVFHSECLRSCLKQQTIPICPLCKRDL